MYKKADDLKNVDLMSLQFFCWSSDSRKFDLYLEFAFYNGLAQCPKSMYNKNKKTTEGHISYHANWIYCFCSWSYLLMVPIIQMSDW